MLCNAGARPATTPVTRETPSANNTTRQSTDGSNATWNGRFGKQGQECRDHPSRQSAPANPATANNTALSVRSWRTSRPREAPIASRTAISRRRAGGTRQQHAGDVRSRDHEHEASQDKQEA